MPDGRDIFGFGGRGSNPRDVNRMLFGGDALRDIIVGPRRHEERVEHEAPIREMASRRPRASLGEVYFEPSEAMFRLNPEIFTGFED